MLLGWSDVSREVNTDEKVSLLRKWRSQRETCVVILHEACVQRSSFLSMVVSWNQYDVLMHRHTCPDVCMYMLFAFCCSCPSILFSNRTLKAPSKADLPELAKL